MQHLVYVPPEPIAVFSAFRVAASPDVDILAAAFPLIYSLMQLLPIGRTATRTFGPVRFTDCPTICTTHRPYYGVFRLPATLIEIPKRKAGQDGND